MKNPGIFMVFTFSILLLVNAIIIYFANSFFPNQIVLGTATTSAFWATILTSGVIALAGTFAMPFVQEAEKKIGRPWAPHEMMGIYLVINFAVVWLISRVSEVFGMGVSSWMTVVLLSVALDILQGAVMVAIEKMRLRK